MNKVLTLVEKSTFMFNPTPSTADKIVTRIQGL